MLDSDVDSWYDWKRCNEMHNTGNNAEIRSGLISSSRSKSFASDDSPRELINYNEEPTSSRSGIHRYINPAIYAETLNNEDVEHEVEIHVRIASKDDERIVANCGDSAEVNDTMATLSISNAVATSFVDQAGDQNSAQETYRCYSLNSPTTSTSFRSGIVRSKSVTSCRPTNRVERRCKIADTAENNEEFCSSGQIDSEIQRYSVNGHRIVQISTSSTSSIRISENRSNESDLAKKLSYHEWMRKKQEAARQKKEAEDLIEKQKQMEIERLTREKEERESRERENFLKWSERKKKEEEKKKAEVEKELELQKQLKEIEDKTAIVKTLCLRQWTRKKKEQEKARQKEEELKQKQIEEEKKKRLEESTKAYENWRKMAKNKPKPATQGLLPHQKAKPAYINPTPWQRIVDEPEEEEEKEAKICRKTQSQPKINSRRSYTSFHQR